MRQIVIISLLIFLSACSSKTTTLHIYTLNPSIDIHKHPNASYSSHSVKVAYPSSIKGIISKRMTYTYDDLEEGTYVNAQWSTSSSKLLMNSFIRVLEKSGVFKATLEYTSLAHTDYLLESEVYEFYHKVRKDLSVAVVSIRFNLIHTQSNTLIKSRKFSYQIPTQTTDAQGYVKATNRAVEKISQDLVQWLAR